MFAYLTAKPMGASLVCLIVAVVLLILAVIDATIPPRPRAWWPALVAAGMTAFVLAFLIS